MNLIKSSEPFVSPSVPDLALDVYYDAEVGDCVRSNFWVKPKDVALYLDLMNDDDKRPSITFYKKLKELPRSVFQFCSTDNKNQTEKFLNFAGFTTLIAKTADNSDISELVHDEFSDELEMYFILESLIKERFPDVTQQETFTLINRIGEALEEKRTSYENTKNNRESFIINKKRFNSKNQNAVYLVSDNANKLFKIGRSCNFKKRFDTILVFNPCCKAIKCVRVNEKNLIVEKRLHEKFKNYHVSGEWFSIKALPLAIEELSKYAVEDILKTGDN